MLAGVLVGPSLANASLEDDLATAQSGAAAAEAQLADATTAENAARSQLADIAPKAARANAKAASAAAHLQEIEAHITGQRKGAAEEIAAAEKGYQDDANNYDEERAAGIGFSLASLVLAAIAFLWKRFRQLSPVQRLVEMDWPRATGIVVAGAVGIILVGGALASLDSLPLASVGYFAVGLGTGLPVCFLLARHSLRVEQGKGQPIFTRGRFPGWVTLVVAVLLLFLFAGGIGEFVGAGKPEKPVTSQEDRALAEAAQGDPLDPPTDELVAARASAAPLMAKAGQLESARQEAEAVLASATTNTRRVRRDLAYAQNQIAITSRRIAEEQALAAQAPSSGSGSRSSGCDPNYVGACVPAGASDVDCAGGSGDGPEYVGPVRVVGSDPYGLDADGDGYACE